MKRNFNDDISTPDRFVITLELVPGREFTGSKLDSIKNIARSACEDGRITAVSITDNPGGNPALSPDGIGSEMKSQGMDVIVHFTCRDTNRVGMESRALQLAHLGLKNILALTGDYAGTGFGGKGSPVFDFDSVILTSMLNDLNMRLIKTGHSEIFRVGCAVSPFKHSEGEAFLQYRKLQRKIEAGASFAITQLGYDIDKYEELLLYCREHEIDIPILASLYLLGKGAAKSMNAGRVPGVHVSDRLLRSVLEEFESGRGREQAIERCARLGVVLKHIGYRGIHLGGIHDSFATAAQVLDRMEEIDHNWRDYKEEFSERDPQCYYMYRKAGSQDTTVYPHRDRIKLKIGDNCHYLFLRTAHDWFFDKNAMLAPVYKKISTSLEKSNTAWALKLFLEDPFKKLMLSCQSCGDCGIQHVGFLCPESGCPKHTRNGPCGGSRCGYCEVNTDKFCVWVRAFHRTQRYGETDKLTGTLVPPRLWELKGTSSWINFHLDRDHQAGDKAA